MAKFKTLNRFLGRIGRKRKTKTSFWSAIWRRNPESTRSSDNGGKSSHGNRGILKTLSSFFKRKPEPTQQSRESRSDGSVEGSINILVEPSVDHQSLDQHSIDVGHYINDEHSFRGIDEHSINDPPEDIITEDELLKSDTVNYDSLSSLSSQHEMYSADYWSSPFRPEDWESSNEWLIFDVPEEPDPQMQMKPKKKVNWGDDDKHAYVAEIDLEGSSDEEGFDKETEVKVTTFSETDGESVEIETVDGDVEIDGQNEEERDSASVIESEEQSKEGENIVEIEGPGEERQDEEDKRLAEIERLGDEKPSERGLLQWITAVVIVFVLLLFM